jgi:hypothetical protein
VIVNNCTNINKVNNHLWSKSTEHKKHHDIWLGNQGTSLGQAQKSVGVKLFNGIPASLSTFHVVPDIVQTASNLWHVTKMFKYTFLYMKNIVKPVKTTKGNLKMWPLWAVALYIQVKIIYVSTCIKKIKVHFCMNFFLWKTILSGK